MNSKNTIETLDLTCPLCSVIICIVSGNIWAGELGKMSLHNLLCFKQLNYCHTPDSASFTTPRTHLAVAYGYSQRDMAWYVHLCILYAMCSDVTRYKCTNNTTWIWNGAFMRIANNIFVNKYRRIVSVCVALHSVQFEITVWCRSD